MQQLDACLQQLPTAVKTLWLAYSGGLDSHVLLHYLATQLKHESSRTLEVVHVNHGLSPNADAWQQHCQAVCDELQLTLHSFRVTIATTPGLSPEALAREARYEVLLGLLDETACLLTAHHQQDQAETLLLQLLRGAGPAGLAAMPRLKTLRLGYHLRPLLDINREELLAYAKRHDLRWIDDESNADVSFDRNYLRHHVLPVLQQRWPAAVKTIARSAEHCARAAALSQQIAAQDYESVASNTRGCLSITRLQALDNSRCYNVLRYWLQHQGLAKPPAIKLQRICQEVLNMRCDAKAEVCWADVTVCRYRDDLYALQQIESLPSNLSLSWDLQQALVLPNNLGTLTAVQVMGEGIVVPEQALLDIRFRQPGQRVKLAGQLHHQSLKKLFQAWGVPRWQRDKIPLLFCNEQLAAVIGYGVCEGFAAKPDELGWQLGLTVHQPRAQLHCSLATSMD